MEYEKLGGTLLAIVLIAIGAMIYSAVIKEESSEVKIAKQKTIQYIGFDGKPHQVIAVRITVNNWMVVERR
jgi:cytochrome c oxidase assembly factor CtaG